MRIFHFYKTYYPDSYGGIEQVIYQLTEGNDASDIQSAVLSLSLDPNNNSVEFSHSESVKAKELINIASTPFSLDALSKFRHMAAQADIIHYHFPYPFMDMVHFMSGVRKPTVVSYHSDILKQKYWLKLYQPLMKRFLGSVTHIVATSPNYFATSPVLQAFRDKVSVIPIGIDPEPYLLIDEQRLLSWQEKLPPRFFLFIGALRYYKGLDTLLEAMRSDNMPVVIMGSGPNEAHLKRRAEQAGITHIHFLGPLANEDKCALLKLSYGIVFPSHLRTEAFGITLLEGALFGKPLITCEIGTGTTFINLHQQTGLAIPPSDPPALREAMRSLWDNPALAASYGAAAQRRFYALFTAKKMTQQFDALYRSMLA
ncbi:glycosyltransferase [Pantoea sp. RRHST58]|uniref:glycosyltransferase n=1 Tax=Pantoea sp. RRHST58 TaxID=3425183 RepID=UPI003DA0B855